MKYGYCWLCLVGVLFFVLNAQIPQVIDDYVYSRSFVGVTSMNDDQDINATIDNVADLIASQVAHYQCVNGRAMVHAVVQMFCCWFGQLPFDVLQGIFFVLLICLIGRLMGARSRLAGLPVVLLMLTLYREPNCLYHGIACGVNYLWVMVLVLLVRWLYLHRAGRIDSPQDAAQNAEMVWWKSAAFIMLAFLAGFSNEAFAIPFVGAFVLEGYLERRRLSRLQFAMIGAMFVGVLLLVVAPSNFNRLSMQEADEGVVALPYHLQPLVNLRLTLLCLLMCVGNRMRGGRGLLREHVFLFSAIALSALMAFAIGGLSIRMCFAAELCSSIVIVRLVRGWLSDSQRRWGVQVCSFVMVLLLVFVNVIQYPKSVRFETAKAMIEAESSPRVVLKIEDPLLSPQLEKYRCCELSEFQLYQFKWWYSKESVELYE